MTYNVRDTVGFPPPSNFRQISFEALVSYVDPTAEVPVVYAFGGNAPTAISIGNGKPFEISSTSGYARMFVEFDPYSWDKT
jgi:hypothetical protein